MPDLATLPAMARTDRCKALAELDSLVNRLGQKGSPAQGRAERWVRGELTRAVRDDYLTRDCCRSLGGHLLTGENIARYLAAAERDDLHVLPRRHVVAKPENSTNVRRMVLRRFAKALGTSPELPPPRPRRFHPPVTQSQQTRLLAHVNAWAQVAPLANGRRDVCVRLACVVALVMETAARTSELLALTVDDFAPDLSAVTVTRRPPGGALGAVETLPLSPAARRAVRAWLACRARLVAQLQGQQPRALLVSVRPGSPLRLAGLPIGPETLREQYTAAVRQLNADMAAQQVRGWTPLPRTLARLRNRADNPVRAAGAAGGPSDEEQTATAA